ncbi:MAG: hypothetical protein ACI7YS_10170 [Flavobacterium sp.]
MKIVKYIFILIILFSIAGSVFVATQKSDFSVEKTALIRVHKSVVFNYLSDYKNWEEWYLQKSQNSSIETQFPLISSGQNAYFTWESSDGDGKIETISLKENDSIHQKIISGGNEFESIIKLKDTLGGTKISWISKGSVDFMTKINATFYGGIDKMMVSFFDKKLTVLKKTIIDEISSFHVQVKGIVDILGNFYIKKTYRCKNADLNNQLHYKLPIIYSFFKKNKIAMTGKPFVIYEKRTTDSITFSVCGSIQDEIFIAPGSDVETGYMEPFKALKTTLKGDYSHRTALQKKAVEYINKNQITPDTYLKEIEVFEISAEEIRNPSKWQTDLLIPVKPIVVSPTTTIEEKDTLQPQKTTNKNI